ncbi:uncharacterized protein LOC129909517 [Episyrphus balteatus]|uniref:uncharacterized protein LOC129909517 n=1 Tax=Episyrphus balteatus TaxID=286459 RepID=UPI002486B4FE|nr:uncharacterized protein LOC129909517 [Episyrphus balteatus]
MIYIIELQVSYDIVLGCQPQNLSLALYSHCKNNYNIRTAPTAALEVITDLPPLHLLLKKEAMVNGYRLIAEDNSNCKIIHSDILTELNREELLKISLVDNCLPRYTFTQNYKVTFPSRHEWEQNRPIFNSESHVWYTDGSKTNEGVGAGVFGMNTKTYLHQSMDSFNSVFRAEIFAIELCLRENLNRAVINKKIYILSDSKAALQALRSNEVISKLVWDCIQLLHQPASTNRVQLIWIPGHSGHVGNEIADTLARKGSASTFMMPRPFCGIPTSTAKHYINKWLRDMANHYWTHTEGNRQAKKFIPNISHARTKQLLTLTRSQIRITTGFLTGHCSVKKHLKTMGITQDDTCRMCNEDEETAEHILCHCNCLINTRRRHLGGIST